MDSLDFLVFTTLFREAFERCFGHAMKNPLTETESKIFCNKILDQTGLSIGWKSVKNYSLFIMDAASGKEENPSVATMDTMARYVLSAPYTDEIRRKNDEAHHPYWFLYREKFQQAPIAKPKPMVGFGVVVFMAGIVVVMLLFLYFKFVVTKNPLAFTDDFKDIRESAMLAKGWFIKDKDSVYWNKRGNTTGQLTLYTLKGDNWPDAKSTPEIKNLLLRAIPSDCFTAEVHIRGFIPKEEWQQAGILLLEDTTFTGKSMRLSLGFNDNFGGLKMPNEIIIQAITSLGNGFGKPEEIAHKPIFLVDSTKNNALLTQNLQNSALRIEKHGNRYRFLYAGGAIENTAFKEIVSQEFDMKPKYIGLFAIKGFTGAGNVPVTFKFFRITSDPCD